ncbi:PHD and RING finger domain-containing protein 1 isoform X2 [Thalassophryne amazonica]|uniref:PHD and RING finger domain-containing protein 1 isoform X2 n=1 Tax=Thalassophryne amazonica TaxID=390379 RepID=UPI00147118FE|nr:PHD and RING finger domain-containing protein 1 isoform X2 [Thalassophryne amazonica]
MDDDDSQDEQINRSTSRIKGNRAAFWAISDDSDNEEESEEAESDSDEEDEEDHLDGEENDNEDGDEEEEECKAENGGSSAEFVEMSSDEDSEKCPICLNSFRSQLVATPETCEHYFCLDCILEWAKNANSCPVDRITFSNIYLRKCFGGKVQKMITVQKPVTEAEEEVVDLELDQTNCEVCGASDREDRLLLCDGCDSGYHMECLTPPLDAVPVEEWFCPDCEANNRHSRSPAGEVSETESVARPEQRATSHSQSHAARSRRAIARTQQSERVRANVNRHRITQYAPTYLMRSTWLDETINAVVAGLNTAVYVRDLTPRVTTRRRRAGKHRKLKSKKTSIGKGRKSRAASTGVKRQKRKARKSKSRKKLVVKKSATPRSRIASSLGIVKSNTGSSLPTVYRPSEHTLSSMRADIGAASLSVYGDPFDLDPFVEREEEQQDHVSSLLEAKRRGISHSALRSHQPVARPVTASLSRGLDVPPSGTVVEAAPVPDLLGSILSGQSMLLMDSSDVIINRDGSLKATKPMSLSPSLNPVCGKSSNTQISPQTSSSLEGFTVSLSNHRDIPGSSYRPLNEPVSQNSLQFPLSAPSLPNHTVIPSFDMQPWPHLNDQPPGPNRLNPSFGHQGTIGVGALNKYPREATSSVHPTPEHCSRNKGTSEPPPKKAPPKPMWVDVSILPRIPKIKRESSSVTKGGTHETNSSGSNRISNGSSSNDTSSTNGSGMLQTGMNSLSGGKGKQQSVDQQQGRGGGQTQRHRSDGAGSSSAFSNSFTTSSSISSQPRFSSLSSSSSSSVSFRINSCGNSWHSRRLSIPSATVPGGSMQLSCSKKEDEARKRQLHRDKQMLLASRTIASKQQDRHNVYDPFNPTVSDSSSSDSEAENKNWDRPSQHATPEADTCSLENEDDFRHIKQELCPLEPEIQESSVLQKMLGRPFTPEAEELECSDESVEDEKETIPVDALDESVEDEKETIPVDALDESVEDEKETIPVDAKVDTQTSLLVSKCKEEPGEMYTGETERCCHNVQNFLNSEMESPFPIHPSPILLKNEKVSLEEEVVQNVERLNSASPKIQNDSTSLNSTVSSSAACSSASTKKKEKAKIKSDSKFCSRSPSRDLSCKKEDGKKCLLSKEHCSGSSETDRGKSGSLHTLGQDGRRRGQDRDRERSSRRSRSRERRTRKRKEERSSCDSSRSSSWDRTRRKRQQSRSRSKERKRSRSASSSSSRERTRRKKHRRRSMERNERDRERGRLSKDKRRHWSRSKSRSKSRSRSRSRERRKDHAHKHHSSSSSRDKMESRSKDKRRYRSRSRSRERRKEGSSKRSQNISQSRISFSKGTQGIKEKHRENNSNQMSVEEKVARLKKQIMPTCTSISKVKVEDKDTTANVEAATAKRVKEQKFDKIKEKQPSFDMFEDYSSIRSIKKEELDTPSFTVVRRLSKEESEKDHSDAIKMEAVEIDAVKGEAAESWAIKTEAVENQAADMEAIKNRAADTEAVETPPVKTEAAETPPVKTEVVESKLAIENEAIKPEAIDVTITESEQSCPELYSLTPSDTSFSTVSILHSPSIEQPVTAGCLQESSCQSCPASLTSLEPSNTATFDISMKGESHQPPDSDDDFNVDLMLDNLDFGKSGSAERSSTSPQQEKEREEGKNKGQQEMVTMGTKSKTPVKRVTWNIQEPEGPQPEKSVSKLALYKLKLKQEGARKSSFTTQTSIQDVTETGSMSDTYKMGGVDPQSASDGVHREAVSTTGQAEAEGGNSSQKDKYLKKLHMQERAVEEVKLAIKPFYQKRDINKDEYKEILRKAVQKVCHSKSGEINPVKVGNLVKAYVDKYRHARKHKKDYIEKVQEQTGAMKSSDSP